MAKYIVVHAYKKGKAPGDFWKYMEKEVPGLARNMKAGLTPARSLMTWNPLPYGRSDCFFCLWEADKPEDINATLKGTADQYVTADIIKVDEIDWSKLA